MKVKELQKKKYKEKESGFSEFDHEIAGILLFLLGVLTFLSFYFNNSMGAFGMFTKSILLGLLGLPAFLIPPFIILYSVFIIFKRDGRIVKLRALFFTILIILVSALIQTGYYKSTDYQNLGFLKSVEKFYLDGKNLSGGGIFGGLICIPFLLTFQTLGTIIIITTLCLIDTILLTNISIANFFKNIKDLILTRYEKKAEKKRIADHFISERNAIVDGLDMEPKPTRKIIDFKIEKSSRELKDKLVIDTEKSNIDFEPQIDPVERIMKDINKNIGSEVTKIRSSFNKEINQTERGFLQYRFPSTDLLNGNTDDSKNIKISRNSAVEGAKKLEDTLKSFGVAAKVVNISRGPTVTRYELQPSPGVKVSRIVSLSDDISLNLASEGVRIEAPIPGKAAVGIEVPNKEITLVLLKDVIESSEFVRFSTRLAFALGKDISGENIIADISKMPHLLIAGATGAGKSVCLNNLIISLLYKATPEETKLLLIDPKVVELGIYNGIPHLLIPVVTDPKKAAGALNWAVQEMVNRYKLFAEKGVRDIKGYNIQLKESGRQIPLPQIVIIIDELADLMMVAPGEVEDAICRLAQMARAAGMHLVIATQRPSVDVITGVIKANIPSRISFAVTSQVDSRTILDMSGAEKLLGKGDMLFFPVGKPKPIRVQGAYISEKEIEKVVDFVKSQGNAEYDDAIIDDINSENELSDFITAGDNDELLPYAIELVVEAGQASISLIQRKFKVGYARAARIVDQMETRGIVGGYEGSKPRQVLINKQQWQELQMTEEN